MNALLLIVGGFALGAMPFSVLIGRYGFKRDIREYGDGNPGAFNVIRAGGVMWGGLAIFLDIFKGALTVGLAAYVVRLDGWLLVLAAIAPVLGHAFSPFLNFQGGKAIATSFGMWIGVTLFPLPMLLVMMLLHWYFAVTISGWAVILTLFSALAYLLLTAAPWTWFAVWVLNFSLIAYKHRTDLRQPLRLRMSPFYRRFFPNLKLAEKEKGM